MYFVAVVLLNLSWVIFSSFSAQPLFRPLSRSTSLSLILFPSISTFFLVFYILSVSLSLHIPKSSSSSPSRFLSVLLPSFSVLLVFFSVFLFSFSFISSFHYLLSPQFTDFVLSKFPSSYPSNFSPPSSASFSRRPLLIVLTISLPLSSFRLLRFHSSS